MRKLLIISAIITTGSLLKGQDKLSSYKAIVDKAIEIRVDSSIYGKMTCTGFSVKTKDNKRWFSKYYETFKDETINPNSIIFNYSFFSGTLGNDFYFRITINDKKAVNDSDLVYAPKCILANSKCNLILKDSAIKIALSDSIDYPENLLVEFQKGNITHSYYWIITGYPSEKKTIKGNTSAILVTQRKIINAATGQIVLSQD